MDFLSLGFGLNISEDIEKWFPSFFFPFQIRKSCSKKGPKLLTGLHFGSFNGRHKLSLPVASAGLQQIFFFGQANSSENSNRLYKMVHCASYCMPSSSTDIWNPTERWQFFIPLDLGTLDSNTV